MPKISVIVPVYKAEQYLPQCIESILSQSYGDLELILVDDGSPDNSGAICDQYASKDIRVKVFHKENGGVSSARNLGIEKAQGEWITFVDADDAIEPNTLSKCSTYFDGVDAVRFSMKYVYSEDGKQTVNYVLSELSKEEYISKILLRDTILGVCGGVYKMKLFKDYNIRFNQNLINGEDWVVLLAVVLLANSIKLLNEPLYRYSKYNETACTKVFDLNRSISALSAQKQIEELLKSKLFYKQYKMDLIKGKCNLIYDIIGHIIINHKSVNRSEFNIINSNIRLTKKELFAVHLEFVKFIILLFYKTHFGKSVIMLRLSK